MLDGKDYRMLFVTVLSSAVVSGLFLYAVVKYPIG